MTLDQIAWSLDATQDYLRGREAWSDVNESKTRDRRLRAFIVKAFAQGHSAEAIQDYVDRSETMVTHTLRFECMTDTASYSRSLPEIKQQLAQAELGRGRG
jgi:hypothetical protein